MKLLSLFSGIGAFEKALDRLGIPYELVGFSEIDKYAIKSYCAIHGVSEELNLGDITKIQGQALPKDIDLISYGFPCQDISLAGKLKGLFNEDGSQTRSGLFFEALRIIEDSQPKVAIAENVKNLTGKTFKTQFEIVLKSLEEAGYNNYWKVLNARDYGVPQNRERVFIVSIRKDIDTGRFTFPEGFPLGLRLKDVLETDVDEKYYLSDEKLKMIALWNCQERPLQKVYGKNSIARTLTTRSGAECGSMATYSNKFEDTTNIEPCILVKEATKKGYAKAYEGDSINLEQPNSKTRRGRVGHGVAQTLTTSPQQAVVEPKICVVGNYSPSGHDASRIVDVNGIAPTVKENHGTVTAIVEPLVWDGFNQRVRADSSVIGTITRNVGGDLKRNGQGIIDGDLNIRKITPREAFRLMDFSDDDFNACKSVGMSDANLYKQAGNSIVVACPFYIIRSLIEAGIFEYGSPYDVPVEEKDEKESEYSCNSKPNEYIFNEKKFIDFLLREGIISIKN